MPPSTSTRWCPTPEQLMILEEMYKSGLRTPNASQIQKITAHLSFYGKIEGKNVFYWFQNHKARDRQKLRRKLGEQLLPEQLFIPSQNQHAQNYNDFKFFSSIHPSCFGLYQPSYDHKSSAEYLHQGRAKVAVPAQMTHYSWKLDTPLQNIVTNSPGDDYMMMMMLREACGTSPCCNHNNRPLKTLDLFPIKTPGLKEQEQHQLCTTNFKPKDHVSSSATPLDLTPPEIKSTM